MPDPAKNADVEDILSSIRRLVSEMPLRDLEPPAPAADTGDETDVAGPDAAASANGDEGERLVLTPALRVAHAGAEEGDEKPRAPFPFIRPRDTLEGTESESPDEPAPIGARADGAAAAGDLRPPMDEEAPDGDKSAIDTDMVRDLHLPDEDEFDMLVFAPPAGLDDEDPLQGEAGDESADEATEEPLALGADRLAPDAEAAPAPEDEPMSSPPPRSAAFEAEMTTPDAAGAIAMFRTRRLVPETPRGAYYENEHCIESDEAPAEAAPMPLTLGAETPEPAADEPAAAAGGEEMRAGETVTPPPEDGGTEVRDPGLRDAWHEAPDATGDAGIEMTPTAEPEAPASGRDDQHGPQAASISVPAEDAATESAEEIGMTPEAEVPGAEAERAEDAAAADLEPTALGPVAPSLEPASEPSAEPSVEPFAELAPESPPEAAEAGLDTGTTDDGPVAAPEDAGEATDDVAEVEYVADADRFARRDDEMVIDEEALREIIAEIVREELQGALGERITRNIRKLARREIHRAMTMRELGLEDD